MIFNPYVICSYHVIKKLGKYITTYPDINIVPLIQPQLIVDQAHSGSPTTPVVTIDTIPEEAEEAVTSPAKEDEEKLTTKESIGEQNLYTFSGPPPRKGAPSRDLLGIKPYV
jgi:hypothetical protein